MTLDPLRGAAAALLLGTVLGPLPGCHPATPSQTPVVRYTGDDRLVISKATADGDYALFDKDAKKPLWTVTLSVGDALGFRREGKHIIAVAGNNEKVLADGTYVWERQ